jgi:hypothetical protein
VRTIGWRAFVGAGFTGFLASTALARLVGRPVVEKLGASSLLATALWVPITEELFKMLPVVLVLVLALRRSRSRPSVLDLTLLGAWTGAGFCLYENAAFGRGVFSLTASPVVSLFFPSTLKGLATGWPMSQTSHLVHTALIALGVAYAVTYGRRVQRPWLVPVVAIAAVLAEHCSQNAIVGGGWNGIVAKAAIIVTLGGRLTPLMLIGGVAYVLVLEWRTVGRPKRLEDWLSVRPSEVARRAELLATAQSRVIHRSVAS